MIISHQHRFVLFLPPLGSYHWIMRALAPFCDQPMARRRIPLGRNGFSHDICPGVAPQVFARHGYVFDDYTRIALIQNPFIKMVHLYDRIALTDPKWRARRKLGLRDPDFGQWLQSTRADGDAASYSLFPRWRRFGAMSAEAWCAGQITHRVRAEKAKQELDRIFKNIGLAPIFACRARDQGYPGMVEMGRYDTAATALILQRYRSDLQLYQQCKPDLRIVATAA